MGGELKEGVDGGCPRFEESFSLVVGSRALIGGDMHAGYIPIHGSLTPVTSDCARQTLVR